MIPAGSPALQIMYDAARRQAAIVDRSDRAHLVVSGADRRSYLNGLLTNDIAALGPGQGCYAAYLTAQGRMIADLWLYELGDVVLVSLHQDAKATVLAKLEQFIFSEDVQLGDLADAVAALAVVGPWSADIVASTLENLNSAQLATWDEHRAARARFRGRSATVVRVLDTGAPGFDLIVDRRDRDALAEALRAAGCVLLDAQAAEALRIEGGVPKWHRDMDEDTIPLEAGIDARAISLTKGCYVGQEVIVRVLHRGHGRVARKLVGLTLEGDEAPAPGASIRSTDAGRGFIGRVTSSVVSPALGRPIALGYVHRDFVAAGTDVVVDGAAAVVTVLPFVQQ